MSRLFYFHIVLFFFGISLQTNAITLDPTTPLQTMQDAVYVDTEPIDKREFENLKDTYTGNEFIYERTVENSGWWSRFKQWLSDFFRNLFDINSEARASSIVDIALNIFVVVLIILVVFFIVKAIINKEGTWVFGKSSDKNIIPVTDIENNIYETDFKSLIAEAEKENNHRLAIRYYYLWLLKTLSEAEVIDYDVEKTNSDYYLEIENKDTKEEFSYTSYLYNYIWYGEFDIDDAQFEKAKKAFTQFLKTLWK